MKLKIFPKTFISSLSLITGITLTAFILIGILTPRFYRAYKAERLAGDLHDLSAQLAEKQTDEITAHLDLFVSLHDYNVTLHDASGGMIYSRVFGLGMMTSRSLTLLPDSGSIQEDAPFTQSSITVSADMIFNSEALSDAGGNRLILNLSSSVQPIDEASAVLFRVLPYVLLVSLGLGTIVSFLYAKSITAPVIAMSKTVTDMKALIGGARCEVNSSDEIGELAVNINELYGRLLSAIHDLQNEMQNTAAADKGKIDFMLTVSHELKTPLTAVNGMVEGMIHHIGVYKDRDEYLIRCGAYIDALTALVNEILDASRLEMSPSAEDYSNISICELAEETAAMHQMIALSKRTAIRVDIDRHARAFVPVKLFAKALANIVSNAVRYADDNSTIRIYLDHGQLVTENICRPLPPDEIRRIFEPLYGTGAGHGLGLYLTERILKVCALPFEFIPFDRGMRFTIFMI
jgi:signal transduction histidine kinase